jgi:hypothetical protein
MRGAPEELDDAIGASRQVVTMTPDRGPFMAARL